MLALGTVAWPQTWTADTNSPTRGTIRGRVVDDQNRPVDGAAVESQIIDRPPSGFVLLTDSGELFRPVTNAGGEFILRNVEAGRNRVCASKVSAGYPDTTVGWFAVDTPCPVVTVKEGEVVTGVLLRMGPRAPRVLGRVVDGRTGAPVTEAYVRAYQGSDSPVFIPTRVNKNGYFELLVPFDEPFRLQVFADGYQP